MALQQTGKPSEIHKKHRFPGWLRFVFIGLGLLFISGLAFIWIRGVWGDLEKVMTAITVILTLGCAFLTLPFLYRSEHSPSTEESDHSTPIADVTLYEENSIINADGERYQLNDDYTLKYSYDRIDRKLRIKPEMLYLSNLYNGGTVNASAIWNTFVCKFPQLSVKIVNNTKQTIVLKEAIIRVTSSIVNIDPVLLFKRTPDGIYIYNEGWGMVLNPVIRFRMTGGGLSRFGGEFWNPESLENIPSDGREFTLKLDSFTNKRFISVSTFFRYFPEIESVYKGWGILTGSIQYYSEKHEEHVVKFAISIYPDNNAGASLPPTEKYDIELESGKSKDYLYQGSFTHSIKSGEADHFVFKVKPDKSARFNLAFSFPTVGGPDIPSDEIVLDTFVPRSINIPWHMNL